MRKERIIYIRGFLKESDLTRREEMRSDEEQWRAIARDAARRSWQRDRRKATKGDSMRSRASEIRSFDECF
jgi:hypothetical protein